MAKTMMDLEPAKETMFNSLLNECMTAGAIDQNLYLEYDVKRGLRDSNGAGVLTGLTEISDVCAYNVVDGVKMPAEGRLYYQGYDVTKLVAGLQGRKFAFEETSYLLLFGSLPNERQLEEFMEILHAQMDLSRKFSRDVIMKAPSSNIMNALQRSILTLYSYDSNPEDTSAKNVLLQSINLIAKIPVIAAYAYWADQHINKKSSLMLRNPDPNKSIAENFLAMIRPSGEYTELEAKVLDIALVIHAEHGGGNNSTFTTHVVTSSGTDTYSAISAAISSLKGPKHGGANLMARSMFLEMMKEVKDWSDESQIEDYLRRVLDKQAFDRTGLIYGMGHAVYTVSDPRQIILKEYAKKLAEEKGRMDEYNLYAKAEEIAKRIIVEKRRTFKPVCANVDFYSGLVYDMLEIPIEMYTPLFAISRIAGWSAHRLEEIINNGKIIRPAYKYVGHHEEYEAMCDRK
ncbi:MAG: citrate/2-methylcitrate synthase [Lachnospiraceae bacterium]|nr:citrate/2-methylcitrate synthase [Lachnospiraceae bacterium]